MSPALRPTAVVAGGAGFIGSHLCERLLSHQVEVVCLDNLSTGREANINHLRSTPHFHFLAADATRLPLHRLTRAHYVFDVIDTEVHASPHHLSDLLHGTAATRSLLEIAQKFSAKFLLASTVTVYHAFLSSTSLSDYFGAAEPEDKEIFSQSKRLAESLTAEFYKHHQLDCRIVRLVDVFGPRMDINGPTPLSRLFHQVRSGGPLHLAADGLSQLYPTFVTDAVEALIKSMFTSTSSGSIFTIASPPPVTEISLAYTLRSQLPARTDIVLGAPSAGTVSIDPAWLHSATTLGWSPQVSLEAGLSHTLKWLFSRPTPTRPKLRRLQSYAPRPPANQESPPRRPPGLPRRPAGLAHRIFWVGMLSLLLFVVLPAFLFLGSVTVASFNLKSAFTHFNSGRLEQSRRSASTALAFYRRSSSALNQLNSLTAIIGLSPQLYRLEKLIHLGQNLSQASLDLLGASSSLTTAATSILGKDSADIATHLESASAATNRAYELLGLVAADLNLDRPNLKNLPFPFITRAYTQLEQQTPQLITSVSTLRSFLTILPDFIGLDGHKRTYLLLLQNNAELRPTGGFIGSFALITFDSGKLLDFQVQDVYSADGQLQGHVEPPAPINTHLGEANWYLRDVNFDPDFPTVARQAEWFIDKEIKRSVDGTIAVNLFVAQEILRSLGPLELTDYQETITADNLWQRAQFHSEIDFFPGSTQKKDFLASLARGLYNQLAQITPEQFMSLATSLNRSVFQKHLLISLIDPNLSKTISNLNWDGRLKYPTCAAADCYLDYLNLVEANLGVNKANFFTTRQIHHQLKVSKVDNLQATTTITYTNSSPSDTWPGGTYKNYLRLYAPLNSSLESVTIAGSDLDLDQVDVTSEHDKTVFGFLVSVPPKQQSQVQISYRLPGKINLTRTHPATNYTLMFQKQSGVGADPFTFELLLPAYISPSGPATFVTDTATDQLFSVDLSQ